MKKNNFIVIKLGESSLGQSKNLFKNLPSIISKLKFYQNQGLKPILVVSALSGHSRKIKKIISSIEIEPPNNVYNGLFCHGEFFSCDLLQKYCSQHQLKTHALIFDETPVQVKKQNESWGIDYIQIKKIKQLLKNNCIPIIPGFIGKCSDGTFAAMNFDCSDITAIILSQQLNLTECIFLKNPGALYEANQKIVSQSDVIEELNYLQLKTYSTHTSTIIHDQAIDIAREKNISLILTSSFDTNTSKISKIKNSNDIFALLYKEQQNGLFEISILHKPNKILQNKIIKKILSHEGFSELNYSLNKDHIVFHYLSHAELAPALKRLYALLFTLNKGDSHEL